MHYFKCYFENNYIGLFSGMNEDIAASKAYTGILKKYNQIHIDVEFEIIEFTRGSKHNIWLYRGCRQQI